MLSQCVFLIFLNKFSTAVIFGWVFGVTNLMSNQIPGKQKFKLIAERGSFYRANTGMFWTSSL